jgi:hypothetical protein
MNASAPAPTANSKSTSGRIQRSGELVGFSGAGIAGAATGCIAGCGVAGCTAPSTRCGRVVAPDRTALPASNVDDIVEIDIPSSPAHSRSARATSTIDCGRASGLFSRQRYTSSRKRGLASHHGLRFSSRGGTSWACARSVSTEPYMNGEARGMW